MPGSDPLSMASIRSPLDPAPGARLGLVPLAVLDLMQQTQLGAVMHRLLASILILSIAVTNVTCVRAGTPQQAEMAPDDGAITDGVACLEPRILHFTSGHDEETVASTIARYQVGCYAFNARKGQVLDIRMLEDSTPNAAVVVFEPGWRIHDTDDLGQTDGKKLPGAGFGDAGKHVHATLPRDGRYLIMAYLAYEGPGFYRMRLGIR